MVEWLVHVRLAGSGRPAQVARGLADRVPGCVATSDTHGVDAVFRVTTIVESTPRAMVASWARSFLPAGWSIAAYDASPTHTTSAN